MSAKSDLFLRLQHLNAAVNLPNLVDIGILPSEYNGVANLLRKGLGIVAFNILEDFIKIKATETLETLSNSLIAFTNLTDSLQESAVFGALRTLSFRAGLEKKEGGDYKLLIQDESLKIHSTKGIGIFELSKFSFFHSSSNISATEIPDFLKALGINGGWATLKQVSDAIGGGLLDLSQSYNNAASRRHSAAHTTSFYYNITWISNIKNDILAITASFDILITARCRQVNSNPGNRLDSHDINNALNYRFLEFSSGNTYRETTAIGGRSRKNWPNLNDAVNFLQPQLLARNEFLIILDASKRIEDWFV